MTKRKEGCCNLSKIKYCVGMERVLNGVNTRKKGLSAVQVINWATGKSNFIGIVYKNSPSDKGIMLNCCPFCKADFAKHREKFTKKAKTR